MFQQKPFYYTVGPKLARNRSDSFRDIYFFCYLATNEKIVITHLRHATEPQTMYHLIAKDKVAQQHILGKHSNCNNFGVTMALLKLQTRK